MGVSIILKLSLNETRPLNAVKTLFKAIMLALTIIAFPIFESEGGSSSLNKRSSKNRVLSVGDSIGIESKNNKIYILYRADKGERLATIASAYNISVDILRNINPLLVDGIKEGQLVRIPLNRKANIQDKKANLDHKVYKVKSGDNLFQIARKFSMGVDQLKKLNKLESNMIKEGQELLVKRPEEEQIKMDEGTALLTADVQPKEAPSANKPGKRSVVYHRLKRNEYPYSLAKKYNVSPDSIMKWNNLSGDIPDIEVGDSLIVGYRPGNAPAQNAATSQKPEDGGDKAVNNASQAKGKADKSVNKNQNTAGFPTYKEEKGKGARIGGGETGKKVALHASLPTGKLVKVTNPSNEKSVAVKVIGQLSEADKEKGLIIKMSAAACDAIGLINEEFQVLVQYSN